jgi:uncharacterized protein (TIGR04255 family)
LRLANAPIIEAVLDLDCDMPPAWNIATVEALGRKAYQDHYPRVQTQFLQGFQIEQQEGAQPRFSSQQGIQAFQFLTEDQRQLVQIRAQGFSFNRLAPYTSLDDYLPEIERTWRLFVGLASPVQVRAIRLRYINRILLPVVADRVELNDYLKIGPPVPDEQRLTLVGFLNRLTAIENETGNRVNLILTAQPVENAVIPVILHIEAFREEPAEPGNWDTLVNRIQSLRDLKNRVFTNSLTEKCLDLFR